MPLRRLVRAAVAFAAAVMVSASAASANEWCLTQSGTPAVDASSAHHGHSMDMGDTQSPAPKPHHDKTGMTVCMLGMSCSPAVLALPSLASVVAIHAARAPSAEARSPSTIVAAPEPPPPRA